MKSAYELAMERLNKQSPSLTLTDEQKREIADLESKFAAKIAQREIAAREDIARAEFAGDVLKADELRQELAADRKKLQDELEEKKQEVRARSAS